MKFSEIIEQASDLLQRKGRITYRSLQREFDLDDEGIVDLKEELLFSHPKITEVDGRGLMWDGETQSVSQARNQPPPPHSQPPATYTPQHLAERIRAEQAAMESRGATEGERKTITALFADLKGSTALIEGLDPEDARAVIDPALRVMMDAVHRYDGYVAQALGDGIFALFGAPIAHEDHPQRALYAALRMQEEMRAYSDQSRLKGGIPLQMRVGINTGEVVVRSIRKDDLHTDYVPVGHSTNLAARMEQIATPGSIVISAYTQKLTEGYFELKALGAADIKGVEEPLQVYEVLGAGPLRTRLQVSARHGLSRFVGRHSEIDQMQQALEQAKAGHGQIVGVMGEPGLGKSRLFYEFVGAYNHTPLQKHDCLLLEAFSISHSKASPYLPIIELLKDYFEIQPTDDARKRQEKIAGKVLILDRSLEDTLPYLFSLLGIEDGQASLQQMDAHIRRQRTFEALKKLFLRESLNQPLLLIFEDLHWIDTETQGFLDTLGESLASAKLLLLVNYRPEYRSAWGNKTYYTQLHLAPLGKAEAEELLTFLLGNDASLRQLKELILEKTEGTPFFMEEVVQTLVEEGALLGERGTYRLDTTPTQLHISPTVQGVLAARIDRLTAEEKELLQQLAVIGRQFPTSLIQHVIVQPEADLYRVLASLQAKEFLYEQPAFPEVEYLFKHALTQEVAYGTVLQERRKELHERTGQALEALYADNTEEHAGALAHHYQHSGNAEKAVVYLHLAGQQAVRRSAHEEAIRHVSLALDLCKTLADTPTRVQQEIELYVLLGAPLMATKGFAAPEVERAYTRARALCQQMGNTPQLFNVLRGLWFFYATRPDHKTARELGEKLLALAQQDQDPARFVDAYGALSMTLSVMGEKRLAHQYAQQGIALYEAHLHRSSTSVSGQDSGVLCFIYDAWSLYFLGYMDQAVTRIQEALQLAQELTDPFNVAGATVNASSIHYLLRDSRAAREQAEAAMTLASDQGFSNILAWGTYVRGWTLTEQGQAEEGIPQIRQGIMALHASGTEIAWPYQGTLLADAYRHVGQWEEGLAVIAEALDVMRKTGEREAEAELYRLRGALTLQGIGKTDDARILSEVETDFQKAIEVARHQEAKSLELRAAMSLARLWQQHGKQAEAHALLARSRLQLVH